MTPSRTGTQRNSVLVLGFILLVAVLLRVLMISRESLWMDEIASWHFAMRDLPGVLRSEVTNPPVYYLLLHFWMSWFGTTEAAIRSLSVVPGVFSVWIVYRLASGMWNRPIALIAALYQAISTFQIYYAQEARCFSWLTAILLVAAGSLWAALHTESARRYWYYGAYALAGALALYTHFMAIFFLAGFGFFVLLRRRDQLIAAGSATALSVVLFFPWLLQMLTASQRGQFRRYLLLKLPQAYFSFLYGDTLIPLDDAAVRHIPQTLLANWWILAAGALSLAVLAWFIWKAVLRWRESMIFVLTVATAPVLMAFLVSFKLMLFDERYLLPASPFLYMAIAAGIWEIMLLRKKQQAGGWAVRAGWAACAAHGVLLLVSLYNYYYNPRFGKEDWRAADHYLETLVPAGQKALVVFDPDYLQTCYQFYATRDLPGLRVTPPMAKELNLSAAPIETAARGYDTILLVRSHEYSDDVLQVLERNYAQQSYRKFPKANPIEVYSFTGRSTPDAR